MTSSKFLKNWSLGFKLNIILILGLVLLLVATLVIVNSSMGNLILQTGLQEVQQEVEVARSRFGEAEQEILTSVKLLAARPGLVEAVANRDADTIEIISLTGRGSLEFDVIDVVDGDGVRIETASAATDAVAEKTLFALALLGIENTGIVSGQEEAGKQKLILAAAVPLRDTSGTIVGALMTGRELDDEFLAEINFFRDNVYVALIQNNDIVGHSVAHPLQEQALQTPGELQADASRDIYSVLDAVALGQALHGETVIVDDLVFFADGEPHALAYTPLEIGDSTQTVLAISTNVGQLASFQRQLTMNIVIMSTLLTLSAVLVIAWFIWKYVASPLGKLRSVAERITGGDYSQQAEVRTTDEIGQLGDSFNSMTFQLRNLISNLERRVAERTQALEDNVEISRNLSTILDRQELVTEVVRQVQAAFDYYHVHIYLVDETTQKLTLAGGTGEAGQTLLDQGHSLRIGQGLVGRAADTRQVVLVPDVTAESNWLPNPLLPDTKSEIAVPIAVGKKVLGVLDVQDNKTDSLDEDDARLLDSLANQVAVALTNAHSFEETTQAREEAEQAKAETETALEALEARIWQTRGQAQLNDKMRGEQDIPTLANNVIHQLCHYLQAQIGTLYVAEDLSLKLAGSYAFSSKKPAHSFNFGEGLVGQAAVEKQPLLIADVPDDYITVRSSLGETIPRHIMVFPFMNENRVVGVVELGTLTAFTPSQLDFIETALASIAIAFNTAQARTHIDELLARTQQQAEELQTQAEELQSQSEELRVTNEELESQTESLRASEAKLQEKQAALDKHNQELQRAQQELEGKAEELALASKYKSEFLANMSHELRTPLNSLLILARTLVDNKAGNLTEDQVESAEIIYSGGQDLLNLINDILDLSKVESGKMTFNIEAMPLTELGNMAEAQFAHVAEEKGLELQIKLADDLPASIETDPQRVKQIVKNLLSNAFKFTSQGSVSLHIYRPEAGEDLSRSGLEPSQAVAISVTDTGIGMTAEQQKIIFEAFQQADGSTSRQYGGTGLGLSISRELAAKLGGQISVASEPGRGSTFTLFLPIASQADERAEPADTEPDVEQPAARRPGRVLIPAARPPAPQPAPCPAPAPLPASPPDDRAELSNGDKTLLIIEDDPKFAKILYDFSHEKGFKCLIAGAGQTGLALVKEYMPEAIILDLNLPDISGWEVLEVLKNDPATRHIPVHIISADEEVLDAYRKGAIGYLTKPVSQADLAKPFEKIEEFISREIKTLLLVEDDANSRRSIKKLLEGSDVRISEAERGQTALDLLQVQSFDCIILDLSLPDMTGFEVLNKMNRLNGQEAGARCPVIVYTGRDLTPEENLELMKYADSVIVKGVKSPERLLDETALFLHRVVADLPADKQRTIKQLYNEDGLLKDKKILIVDDDVRNSFALSKLLTDKRLIVRIAQNGQQALDLLAEDPDIDLVLMDIMMPVMDGYETTQRIRAQQDFSSLPILALTAKAMKGDREKCLAVGANDYLPKPIDVDRLFSMLRVWLYR